MVEITSVNTSKESSVVSQTGATNGRGEMGAKSNQRSPDATSNQRVLKGSLPQQVSGPCQPQNIANIQKCKRNPLIETNSRSTSNQELVESSSSSGPFLGGSSSESDSSHFEEHTPQSERQKSERQGSERQVTDADSSRHQEANAENDKALSEWFSQAPLHQELVGHRISSEPQQVNHQRSTGQQPHQAGHSGSEGPAGHQISIAKEIDHQSSSEVTSQASSDHTDVPERSCREGSKFTTTKFSSAFRRSANASQSPFQEDQPSKKSSSASRSPFQERNRLSAVLEASYMEKQYSLLGKRKPSRDSRQEDSIIDDGQPLPSLTGISSDGGRSLDAMLENVLAQEQQGNVVIAKQDSVRKEIGTQAESESTWDIEEPLSNHFESRSRNAHSGGGSYRVSSSSHDLPLRASYHTVHRSSSQSESQSSSATSSATTSSMSTIDPLHVSRPEGSTKSSPGKSHGTRGYALDSKGTVLSSIPESAPSFSPLADSIASKDADMNLNTEERGDDMRPARSVSCGMKNKQSAFQPIPLEPRHTPEEDPPPSVSFGENLVWASLRALNTLNTFEGIAIETLIDFIIRLHMMGCSEKEMDFLNRGGSGHGQSGANGINELYKTRFVTRDWHADLHRNPAAVRVAVVRKAQSKDWTRRKNLPPPEQNWILGERTKDVDRTNEDLTIRAVIIRERLDSIDEILGLMKRKQLALQESIAQISTFHAKDVRHESRLCDVITEELFERKSILLQSLSYTDDRSLDPMRQQFIDSKMVLRGVEYCYLKWFADFVNHVDPNSPEAWKQPDATGLVSMIYKNITDKVKWLSFFQKEVTKLQDSHVQDIQLWEMQERDLSRIKVVDEISTFLKEVQFKLNNSANQTNIQNQLEELINVEFDLQCRSLVSSDAIVSKMPGDFRDLYPAEDTLRMIVGEDRARALMYEVKDDPFFISGENTSANLGANIADKTFTESQLSGLSGLPADRVSQVDGIMFMQSNGTMSKQVDGSMSKQSNDASEAESQSYALSEAERQELEDQLSVHFKGTRLSDAGLKLLVADSTNETGYSRQGLSVREASSGQQPSHEDSSQIDGARGGSSYANSGGGHLYGAVANSASRGHVTRSNSMSSAELYTSKMSNPPKSNAAFFPEPMDLQTQSSSQGSTASMELATGMLPTTPNSMGVTTSTKFGATTSTNLGVSLPAAGITKPSRDSTTSEFPKVQNGIVKPVTPRNKAGVVRSSIVGTTPLGSRPLGTKPPGSPIKAGAGVGGSRPLGHRQLGSMPLDAAKRASTSPVGASPTTSENNAQADARQSTVAKQATIAGTAKDSQISPRPTSPRPRSPANSNDKSAAPLGTSGEEVEKTGEAVTYVDEGIFGADAGAAGATGGATGNPALPAKSASVVPGESMGVSNVGSSTGTLPAKSIGVANLEAATATFAAKSTGVSNFGRLGVSNLGGLHVSNVGSASSNLTNVGSAQLNLPSVGGTRSNLLGAGIASGSASVSSSTHALTQAEQVMKFNLVDNMYKGGSNIPGLDLRTKREQILHKLEHNKNPEKAAFALLVMNLEMRDAAFDAHWKAMQDSLRNMALQLEDDYNSKLMNMKNHYETELAMTRQMVRDREVALEQAREDSKIREQEFDLANSRLTEKLRNAAEGQLHQQKQFNDVFDQYSKTKTEAIENSEKLKRLVNKARFVVGCDNTIRKLNDTDIEQESFLRWQMLVYQMRLLRILKGEFDSEANQPGHREPRPPFDNRTDRVPPIEDIAVDIAVEPGEGSPPLRQQLLMIEAQNNQKRLQDQRERDLLMRRDPPGREDPPRRDDDDYGLHTKRIQARRGDEYDRQRREEESYDRQRRGEEVYERRRERNFTWDGSPTPRTFALMLRGAEVYEADHDDHSMFYKHAPSPLLETPQRFPRNGRRARMYSKDSEYNSTRNHRARDYRHESRDYRREDDEYALQYRTDNDRELKVSPSISNSHAREELTRNQIRAKERQEAMERQTQLREMQEARLQSHIDQMSKRRLELEATRQDRIRHLLDD